MTGQLDSALFKTVVINAPLVSIDLCLIFEEQILLGKRNYEPLKGQWFTPGGRIFKDETWQNALRRIAFTELGIDIEEINAFELMGVWDHFYDNSYFGQNISTHYVNLPHFIKLEFKPTIFEDDQHEEFAWFNLSRVASDELFDDNIRSYAAHLVHKVEKYVIT